MTSLIDVMCHHYNVFSCCSLSFLVILVLINSFRVALSNAFTVFWISKTSCLIISVSEIQNIQIADGDVCRNMPIPIYMVFPRLFTCATVEAPNFKIGNVLILIYLLK